MKLEPDPDYEFENYEMRNTDSESGSEYETNNPESSMDSSMASDSEYDEGDSQGFRKLGADGENQQQSMYLMDKNKKRLVIKDGKIVPGSNKAQRRVGGGEGW